MPNVLIVLTLPEAVRMQYFNHLKQHFPGIKLDMVDHHRKVDPYIAAAEILITFGPHVASHVFEKAKSLKWVQALGTGVDGIADQPGLRKDVLLTNMHGFHGGPVSEAALLAMLSLARNLPRSLRQQAGRKWDRFPVKLLKGKTVGIFGVGTIAAELAPKCKALGMKVVGVSSAARTVPGFDAMHGRGELERVVKDWDYFVLLTPFTPDTKNIVDAKIFAAMKPSSFFVNLARGGVVDEDALHDALKERKIAGAALDVFAKEPLPEDSPFWDMENVIVTQHQGGFFDGYPGFALPVVEENMRKYLAGDFKGMINVVKR
ncbi:MAG: D-2-hydroxyacid dehydrogenase [Betaproteobacteria bacterium]|nr:MAG: D-2-hydroxyacid dehydrogenase [Betaproteobacteria bacterium]